MAPTAPAAFESPVYITSPALPPYEAMQVHFRELWDSRWLSNLGSKHQQLEAALRETLGVDNVDLFCNGTQALTLALKAMGITGEVITTPFTFPATPHSVVWAGASPVFVDIDPESLCIDPAAVEDMIGPDTEAILGVHVYGVPCAVDTLQSIADCHGLRLIYDAAHAFRSEIDGKPISTFGDATMFSFHATKLFHTLEGGALAYRDSSLKDRLGLLRNFGIRDERTVELAGTNAKLNEVQCAFGLEMLNEAELEMERRKAVRKHYMDALADVPGLRFVCVPDNVLDSMQYMVMLVDQDGFGISADALCEGLKAFNIFARRYFYPLCTEYGCYDNARKGPVGVAERVAEEVVCLPFYGALSASDIERIVEAIAYIRTTA